jgi:cell volume regulation protein A
MSDGGMILVAGAMLAAGIAATLVAGRLRVPGLLLFLGLGMAIGSDGFGWIDFDDAELTRTIGIVALSLILFEGGFAAGWQEIRPVLVPSLSLASVGTLITAAITGLAAMFLLDFSTLEGLLLGSIVATTDSAAIFSVLRGSALNRRLARTLEGESGFNDPFAILLVLGFIEWIEDPGFGVGGMILLFAQEIAIGAAVGLLIGRAAVEAFRKLNFATSGLYPVASIAAAALAFGIADSIHGSGFLAVYLAGLTLGSGSVPGRRTIGDFHAGLAWVSQIALFLTLGLLVFPSDLGEIAGEGLLLAAVLMFAARPLAALISTAFSHYSLRESLLLGWAGLRGAIPIVLATFPVIEGVSHSDELFNIVFFVVITSTLVQGATFEPLARGLGVTSDEPALGTPVIEVGTVRRLGAEVVEFPVQDGYAIAGRLVNELGLPREALVSIVVRGDEALLPRGSTEIEAGDRLHILMPANVRKRVEDLFSHWREGPLAADEEPPRAPVLGRPAIFTVRPWRDGYGDPGSPHQVAGSAVVRTLRTRRGVPGALVQLEDGRLAVTGPDVLAVGGPRKLSRYTRDRIASAADPQSRAWWQEVSGVVSQRGAL